jgi:hypothetical protein
MAEKCFDYGGDAVTTATGPHYDECLHDREIDARIGEHEVALCSLDLG